MHAGDFELVSKQSDGDGNDVYRVRIVAAGIEREYTHHADQDSFQISGAERTIKIGGHDMTSIIGKRVREWLRSEVLTE